MTNHRWFDSCCRPVSLCNRTDESGDGGSTDQPADAVLLKHPVGQELLREFFGEPSVTGVRIACDRVSNLLSRNELRQLHQGAPFAGIRRITSSPSRSSSSQL